MLTVPQKAIVIGAGIAGLAAAIRMRLKGFDVTVFEAAAQAGGKLNQRNWKDFRFDTGPSLLTLPGLIEELFREAGKNPSDYIQFQRLPVVTRYWYEGGKHIDAYSDPDRFALEVEAKTGVPSSRIHTFLKLQARNYRRIASLFLEKPVHKLSSLWDKRLPTALLNIPKMGLFTAMNRYNQRFFRNKEIVRLFNRFGTYNGSNPYRMPAFYNIIAHLEHNEGAFLPVGGMYQVAASLFLLASEIGVSFQFDTKVDRIRLSDKKTAAGVEAAGKFWPADLVFSNMDAWFTYHNLLPGFPAPKKYIDQPKTTSAMIFYWAMDKDFPALEVHNIFFSEDYRAEFTSLFSEKKLSTDPTVYLYISSKAVPADAPAGKENWFAMINTPHLTDGHDWDKLKEKARLLILEKVRRITGIDPLPHILHEMSWTPEGIEKDTQAHLGALYGNNFNGIFSAFQRHPNFSKIKNLFFCGGTVHPGGGIPLCLLSARIATRLATQDL